MKPKKTPWRNCLLDAIEPGDTLPPTNLNICRGGSRSVGRTAIPLVVEQMDLFPDYKDFGVRKVFKKSWQRFLPGFD